MTEPDWLVSPLVHFSVLHSPLPPSHSARFRSFGAVLHPVGGSLMERRKIILCISLWITSFPLWIIIPVSSCKRVPFPLFGDTLCVPYYL